MRPEAPAFLWDALDAAQSVQTFVVNQTWETYGADALLQAAVERKLEVAGEALNKLRKADPVTAERIPHVHRVIGMRNVLIHGYAEVDPHQVWVAATEEVPNLITVLDALLAEASSTESGVGD